MKHLKFNKMLSMRHLIYRHSSLDKSNVAVKVSAKPKQSFRKMSKGCRSFSSEKPNCSNSVLA